VYFLSVAEAWMMSGPGSIGRRRIGGGTGKGSPGAVLRCHSSHYAIAMQWVRV